MSDNIVIGIDPGESTGFAQFENGKLTRLWTFKPLQAIAYLQSRDEGLYVMEDSRLQSFVFDRDVNAKCTLKIARNIGQIDMLCGLYESALSRNQLIKLSPLQKGSKVTDASMFNAITGWENKSNQNSRDSAMVAFPFRNGANL
jgi:hypothetical protein